MICTPKSGPTNTAISEDAASQWHSGVERPEARQKLGTLMELPEKLHIYDMMVVGYPDAGPSPKLLRERAEMVHYDYCRKEDIRTNEEVQEFFARSRNSSPAQTAGRKAE